MKKNKKLSLIRRIKVSLFMLFLFFCLTIVVFQFYSSYNNRLDQKTSDYNNVYTLINELQMTVYELDRLNTIYSNTHDGNILAEYEELVKIYKGLWPRISHKYLLYKDIGASFRTLFIDNIKRYNPDYLDKALVILDQVDHLIEEQNLPYADYISHLGFIDPIDFDSQIIEDTNKLKSSIKSFTVELTEYQNDQVDYLTSYISLFKTLTIAFISIIVIYGIYFLIKLYKWLIQPLQDGIDVLKEINKGNQDLRLNYKYNNEVYDFFNSINQYIDLSQNSISLIEEQYNRLRLYSDIGEINYFEYCFETNIIKIFYSKKFVENYQIANHIMTYTVKEYLTLVHPNDRKEMLKQLQSIYKRDNKEYKLDFRVKYPDMEEYSYLSTVGQIKTDAGNFFMGVQFDISYLKEIQNELQQQKEQYRLIIENSTDLIGKMDKNGNIIYLSKSYRDIFWGGKNNINDYNDMLKVTNKYWMDKVLKPPYSSQEVILIDTVHGEKWISWNNDAILNEDGEVEYIITVGHDITELKRMNDKLKYESEHDMLTGLLNRRGLFNTIKQFEHVDRLAAFFIDLNNFKNINDLYGHELGDKIITLLARDLIIYEKEGCLIGRLSGDEFLVLVPNYANKKSLNTIKNYLNKFMYKNYRVNNNDIYISASIGYALYPIDTDNLDQLISFADIAMYECKLAQADHCIRFTKDMFELVNLKVGMANDLKMAIDKDDFEVHFQEIINVATHEVQFIEALMRWNKDDRLIMPKDFIPIAEESGFMQVLDLLIIEKTFRYFGKMKENMKYRKTKLSVNVSPILLLRNNFPNQLNDLVKRYHLYNDDICVEVSENTFVNNIEQSKQQIRLLRQLGFIVALDDFGREYSSLSILDKVDFDIIKIDRLFIHDLNAKLNLEIINMIQRIAKLTNNIVIAEGVETEEQKNILSDLGCYIMQGYLFSKPSKIEIEELEMS